MIIDIFDQKKRKQKVNEFRYNSAFINKVTIFFRKHLYEEKCNVREKDSEKEFEIFLF